MISIYLTECVYLIMKLKKNKKCCVIKLNILIKCPINMIYSTLFSILLIAWYISNIRSSNSSILLKV